MSLIDKVLQTPTYGWADESGALISPTKGQICREALIRINIFRSRKNWLSLAPWLWVLCLVPAPILFAVYYFSWPLAVLSVVFGLFGMSTHGTVWYHRYCTHRAFKFTNGFWRFLTQNLVPKLIPEEIYVVSHHVHHAKSDKPGDPYNAGAGFLYCFLADINHQSIAKDLDEADYLRTVRLLSHTGIYLNSYAQYQKWGSISHPAVTIAHWVLNWAFWYFIFFLIGGHALALALFSGALLWALGVRTFNYQGHGKGKDKRQEGVDFNWKDLSVNQYRPGLMGSEWHNNHHLFPTSAQSGFLPHQWDNAWIYIYLLHKIGGISSYRNAKQQFLKEYYLPRKKSEIASKGNQEASQGGL